MKDSVTIFTAYTCRDKTVGLEAATKATALKLKCPRLTTLTTIPSSSSTSNGTDGNFGRYLLDEISSALISTP